jgi:uncharacterized protein (DUF1778 family)
MEGGAMGRKKKNPKMNVFSFRADKETAEMILAAAAGYPTLNDFLLQAATVTAMSETIRARVSERLRG